MYIQDAMSGEDLQALEDEESFALHGPRPPPLKVLRRALPIMALGQGRWQCGTYGLWIMGRL